MKGRRKYRQLPLFTSVKLDRSTVRLKSIPFPHIEIRSDRGCIMLPVKELLRAKRLIDGLSLAEKRAVMELLELARTMNYL